MCVCVCVCERERANMPYQEIACTRSFHMGLTSTQGKKLERFESTAYNTFTSPMKFYLTHFVLVKLVF
jgi:hypothetical protein